MKYNEIRYSVEKKLSTEIKRAMENREAHLTSRPEIYAVIDSIISDMSSEEIREAFRDAIYMSVSRELPEIILNVQMRLLGENITD